MLISVVNLERLVTHISTIYQQGGIDKMRGELDDRLRNGDEAFLRLYTLVGATTRKQVEKERHDLFTNHTSSMMWLSYLDENREVVNELNGQMKRVLEDGKTVVHLDGELERLYVTWQNSFKPTLF